MTFSAAPWVTNVSRPFTINTYNESGALADVTSATLTIYLPDGTTTTPSVSKASTGTYVAYFTPTVAGHYGNVWTVSGVADDSFGPDAFDVYDPAIIPGVGLAEVKAQLNIPATDQTKDGELMAFIAAATGIAEGKVGNISQKTVVEVHSGGVNTRLPAGTYYGGVNQIVLRQPPCAQVQSVIENGIALTSSQYAATTSGVITRTSQYQSMEWITGFNNITVTYLSGRTSIPADLSHALKVLVAHLWETQRGASTRRRTGDEYVGGMTYSLPNRVEEVLNRYQISGVA